MKTNHAYSTFNKLGAVIIGIALLITPALAAGDSFSVLDQREITLTQGALDLAVSSDGAWTFVLTKDGQVAIYGISGDLVQTLKVGKGFTTIEYSPAGNRILLGSLDTRQLKVISLSLIYELDYRGSPFRGAAGAKVVIAVFNDFQ